MYTADRDIPIIGEREAAPAFETASPFVPNGMGTALPAVSERRGGGKFNSLRVRYPEGFVG